MCELTFVTHHFAPWKYNGIESAPLLEACMLGGKRDLEEVMVLVENRKDRLGGGVEALSQRQRWSTRGTVLAKFSTYMNNCQCQQFWHSIQWSVFVPFLLNKNVTWINVSNILKLYNLHVVIVWLQFHVQGQRWYQKEFLHEMTFDLTTRKQAPEVCFDLQPGTNYSINISMVALNFSLLVSMTTQITGRSCYFFFLCVCVCFQKGLLGMRDAGEIAWFISVLYGGLSEGLFLCLKFCINICFPRFSTVAITAGEKGEKWSEVFWSVIFVWQGKDSLVG